MFEDAILCDGGTSAYKATICRTLVSMPPYTHVFFLDSLIVHILTGCSLYIDTDNLHVDLENAKKNNKNFRQHTSQYTLWKLI